jgi:hypothetical protein
MFNSDGEFRKPAVDERQGRKNISPGLSPELQAFLKEAAPKLGAGSGAPRMKERNVGSRYESETRAMQSGGLTYGISASKGKRATDFSNAASNLRKDPTQFYDPDGGAKAFWSAREIREQSKNFFAGRE